MVVYTVALQALRLDYPLLGGGKQYSVSFKRKGMEITSLPQRCVFNGELTIPPATAKGYNIEFESQKDRRTIEVYIDEIQTGSGKKSNLAELKFDLINQCNVFGRQAVHVIRDFHFRSGGADGTLQVSLLMFPAGSTPPPPPQASGPHSGGSAHPPPPDPSHSRRESATPPQAGGSHVTPSEPTVTLSTRALKTLSSRLPRNQLVLSLSARTLFPTDVGREIEELVAKLSANSELPGTVATLEGEVARLENELILLRATNDEKELEIQKKAAAVKKSSAAALAGAGAYPKKDVAAAIAKMKKEVAAADAQIAAARAAVESDDDSGASSPPPEEDFGGRGQAAAAAGPVDADYLADLKHQHKMTQERIQHLSAGDSVQSEAAMEELMQLLQLSSELEALIAGASGGSAAATQSAPAAKRNPPAAARRKKKKVQFMVGDGDGASDGSGTLFSAHLEIERIEYGLKVLEAIDRGASIPPLPPSLAFFTAGSAAAAPPIVTAPPPQPAKPKSQVDDLFGNDTMGSTAAVPHFMPPSNPTSTSTAPPAASFQVQQPTPAAAPAPTAAAAQNNNNRRQSFGDLFGAAVGVGASSHQPQPNPPVNQYSAAPSGQVTFGQQQQSAFPPQPQQQPLQPASYAFQPTSAASPSSTVVSSSGATPQFTTTSTSNTKSLFEDDIFGFGAVPAGNAQSARPQPVAANPTPAPSFAQHQASYQQQPPPPKAQPPGPPAAPPQRQVNLFDDDSFGGGGGGAQPPTMSFGGTTNSSAHHQNPNPQLQSRGNQGPHFEASGYGVNSLFGSGASAGVMNPAPSFSQPAVGAQAPAPVRQAPLPTQGVRTLAFSEDRVLRIMYVALSRTELQVEVINLHPSAPLTNFSVRCESEDLFGPPLNIAVQLPRSSHDSTPPGDSLHFALTHQGPVPTAGDFWFLLVVTGQHNGTPFRRSAKLKF